MAYMQAGVVTVNPVQMTYFTQKGQYCSVLLVLYMNIQSCVQLYFTESIPYA